MLLQDPKIIQVKWRQFKPLSVVQLDSFFCSLTQKILGFLKYREERVTDNAGEGVGS
jgi:hypothetical protein